MSSHLEQLGFGIQPPGGINFSRNLDGVDVPGSYIDLPSGERAQQFNFSSDILTRDTENNQGVLSGISDNTQVKTYLSNTGHLEVVLEGPSSEVGSTGSRSLWKNGEYQPGHADYITVGNKTAFENELKAVTLNEIKNRKSSNADGVVYPALLNMSDGEALEGRDLKAEKLAQELAEQKAKTSDESKNPFLYKEFGKVDNIIRKLNLRNLYYPIDADFGNSQDYMQINQFKYRPPNQDLFFGSRAVKDESNNEWTDLLLKGVPLGAPYNFKEDFLGLVKLPMPNSLADSNNVSWGADQLNALTAAVSSAVFGKGQETITAFTDLFRNSEFKNANLLQKFNQMLGTGFGQIRNAVDDGVEGGGDLLKKLGEGGSNLSVLGQAIAGSALLNAFQFGITPETVLARGQGVVPNNNLALLFNSPTLREFTFTWKMTPRSREEAQRVNNIIRFFKQGMAPKKDMSQQTGEASYFLGTPNVFDIAFKTTKEGGSSSTIGNYFFPGDDENHSVVRIKTCACTGTAINYTPDGMWNAYDRGQPVSVTMSLRFAELEPIFDTDYDENTFNYSPNRTDLRPVPIDAVGY